MSGLNFNSSGNGYFEDASWTWTDYKEYSKNKRGGIKPNNYNPKPKSTTLASDLDKLTAELRTLLLKKQSDYGSQSISTSPGGPLSGIIVRIHDKVSRIVNIVFNKKSIRNESLIDTFLDIAGYCLIAVLVLQDKWGKNEKNSRNL